MGGYSLALTVSVEIKCHIKTWCCGNGSSVSNGYREHVKGNRMSSIKGSG